MGLLSSLFGGGGGGGGSSYAPKSHRAPGYYSGLQGGQLSDDFRAKRDPDAEWAADVYKNESMQSYKPRTEVRDRAMQDYDTASQGRMANMLSRQRAGSGGGLSDFDIQGMQQAQGGRDVLAKQQIGQDFNRLSGKEALRHAFMQENLMQKMPQVDMQRSWSDLFNRSNMFRELKGENTYKMNDYNNQLKHAAAIAQANAMSGG